MITKIENYYLSQPINEVPNLKEFTAQDYIDYVTTKGPKDLSNEKLYEGDYVSFNDNIWQTTIGTSKGLISNIMLQIMNPVSIYPYHTHYSSLNDTSLHTLNININSFFKSTLEYLINKIGKYDKHSLFSKKYLWQREEGDIIFYMGNNPNPGRSKWITLILTSKDAKNLEQYWGKLGYYYEGFLGKFMCKRECTNFHSLPIMDDKSLQIAIRQEQEQAYLQREWEKDQRYGG